MDIDEETDMRDMDVVEGEGCITRWFGEEASTVIMGISPSVTVDGRSGASRPFIMFTR